MLKMTESQRLLLLNLQKRAVVFSGAETDDERLAMLQLYAKGYVTPLTSRMKRDAMEWRITNAGRKALNRPA